MQRHVWTQRVRGPVGSGVLPYATLFRSHLLGRIIDVAGGVVVGIAAVGGVPLIGAGPVRTAGCEAGRRGVEAVAVDQHHLSVNNRGAIRPDQRKGDAARRVEAALQDRRVLQRHGGTQRDRGLVGGGAERGVIHGHLLFSHWRDNGTPRDNARWRSPTQTARYATCPPATNTSRRREMSRAYHYRRWSSRL